MEVVSDKKKREQELKSDASKAMEFNKNMPTVKRKVDHYINIISATENLIKAINTEYKKLTNKHYEQAKLDLEKVELESKLSHYGDMLEMYQQRMAEYQKWFDIKLAECNEHFDGMWEQALEIEDNLRLAMAMKSWKELESPSDQHRVEMYLLLRQEVENEAKRSKKRR